MAIENKVKILLDSFLSERKDLFQISCKISLNNHIEIILDGDHSISIQDCLDCSRAIENNLDREEEDFELTVLSAGLSNPLVLPRQFMKNIGRDIKITTNDKEFEANLLNANEEQISLKREEKRPKTIGKGKETVVIEENIEYKDIKKALIVIKF